MSEQVLNSTSAQLGYTVPVTLVHAEKYRTEDKSTTDITNTKHNPEKANNTKHSKNKTTLVQSPFTTLDHKMKWAYSTMLLSPHGARTSGELRGQ